MNNLQSQINTWIFDLDNTLYSADSGIFQQVHDLMGKYVSSYLNIDIDEAKSLDLTKAAKEGIDMAREFIKWKN